MGDGTVGRAEADRGDPRLDAGKLSYTEAASACLTGSIERWRRSIDKGTNKGKRGKRGWREEDKFGECLR